MKKSSRKSLLIVTQHFYPEVAATAQLMTDLAVDLAARGLDVTVLAAVPYYLLTPDLIIPSKEEYKGVKIIRVYTTRFNLNNVLGRIPNWLSFHFFVMLKCLLIPRHDVVLTLTIPPYIAFVGMLIRKIKGSKFMFGVQDIYPDVAVGLGLIKNKVLIKLLLRLTVWNYKKADKIVPIGEVMRDEIIRHGIRPDKITVIHNWADSEELYPVKKEDNPLIKELGIERKFIISYSGNFGIVHDFNPVKQAIMDLKDYKDIVFLFIGNGTEKRGLQHFVEYNKVKNVLFIKFQPREKILYSLNACDVSLVSMKKGMEGKLVPSKLYGILSVGKPVIGICYRKSEVADIITENRCGMIVEDNNLSGRILDLYNNKDKREEMGRNSRTAFMKRYDRHIAADKYYNEVTSLCEDITK